MGYRIKRNESALLPISSIKIYCAHLNPDQWSLSVLLFCQRQGQGENRFLFALPSDEQGKRDVVVTAVCQSHKVPIFKENHIVCPLVGIGTPQPLSCKSVPPGRKRGGGTLDTSHDLNTQVFCLHAYNFKENIFIIMQVASISPIVRNVKMFENFDHKFRWTLRLNIRQK